MSTIQPTVTSNLSSVFANPSAAPLPMCPHKKPGSDQQGAGEVAGQNPMLKVIEQLIGLLGKLLSGTGNEPTSSTTQSPGAPAQGPSQEGKSGSFLDKIGNMVLGFFSGGIGKLFS